MKYLLYVFGQVEGREKNVSDGSVSMKGHIENASDHKEDNEKWCKEKQKNLPLCNSTCKHKENNKFS